MWRHRQQPGRTAGLGPLSPDRHPARLAHTQLLQLVTFAVNEPQYFNRVQQVPAQCSSPSLSVPIPVQPPHLLLEARRGGSNWQHC